METFLETVGVAALLGGSGLIVFIIVNYVQCHSKFVADTEYAIDRLKGKIDTIKQRLDTLEEIVERYKEKHYDE